jgi:uridine kinase
MHVELKDSLKVGNTRFIGIDGHGGSGKSTLAGLLAERLQAEVIRTDDFAGWDNPENWWPLVIERVFEPIKNGAKTLSYPRSKWWETHEPEPVVDQPVTSIMILEGVTALRNEFRPYLAFGIFVNAPRDICLQRGFERDKGQDGKSDEEIRHMWEQWYEKETFYIDREKPQDAADMVLDGTKPFEGQIEAIMTSPLLS